MRGGKRERAGRPKGSINKRSAAKAEKIAAEGVTPLDVMIANMRFFHAEALKLASDPSAVDFKTLVDAHKMAQQCAADAAPFLHPRLQSSVVKQDVTGTLAEFLRALDQPNTVEVADESADLREGGVAGHA